MFINSHARNRVIKSTENAISIIPNVANNSNPKYVSRFLLSRIYESEATLTNRVMRTKTAVK